MVRVVTSLNISGRNGSQIIEQIHKPQNALMHQKIQRAILAGITPILAEIISERNEKGVYNTPYPYECMEMVMAYGNAVYDEDIIEMTPAEKWLACRH